MIHKLRFKLITASMLSLILVLAVIMGTAGAINYENILSDADSVLSLLAENNGSFPDMDIVGEEPYIPGNRSSPELPYETRFFFVFFTEEGTLLSVNTGKIAAVDNDAALSYAQTVLNSGKTKGFILDYRYIVYTTEEEIHIIFLDCGRELGAFRRSLLTSMGISSIGLLAVLLLMIILSERIVKPFSQNYEKQKRFITDAGHELKTPLTIIDADTEVLEMDMGENEWLGDIRNQIKRLAQLTNSLIQLARMEEQPETEKIQFSLSDLLEETVETFQGLARAQHKSLSTQIQPMLSMYGDQNAIRQLITILLDNAVKYSQEGGEIQISLYKKKNLIHMTVFNTAESVPRESLGRLFDRFYRAEPSRNSSTGGYGLGLSIASAIVAAHKGKIYASTQDEKSLSLVVTFPT